MNLAARADTTPEYPEGYNAKSCPLDRTMITLYVSPSLSDAAMRNADTASTSSVTQRDLTSIDLYHICRQVAKFPFTGADYADSHIGRGLRMTTSIVQPGRYVMSVTANMMVRALKVDELEDVGYDWSKQHYVAEINNNRFNRLGIRFEISAPRRLLISVGFWWANTAGEVALFKIGP